MYRNLSIFLGLILGLLVTAPVFAADNEDEMLSYAYVKDCNTLGFIQRVKCRYYKTFVYDASESIDDLKDIENYKSTQAQGFTRYKALGEAIKASDLPRIDKILTAWPELANPDLSYTVKNYDEWDHRFMVGDTPLFLAVQTHKLKTVKLLLEHGAQDIAADNFKQNSAFLYAAHEGLDAIVTLLLISGTSQVNTIYHGVFTSDKGVLRDLHGTALDLAACSARLSTVELLLKFGAQLQEHPPKVYPYNGRYADKPGGWGPGMSFYSPSVSGASLDQYAREQREKHTEQRRLREHIRMKNVTDDNRDDFDFILNLYYQLATQDLCPSGFAFVNRNRWKSVDNL